jgi:hypothetical protein
MDELRQIGQALAAHNNEVGLLHGVHDDRPPPSVVRSASASSTWMIVRLLSVSLNQVTWPARTELVSPPQVKSRLPPAKRQARTSSSQMDLTKELAKLDRYERRARSRRKSAIGRYTAS